MSSWISGIPAVEATRNLATSALPDAPVVPDSLPPQRHVRVFLATTLRSFADGGLRLAERLDSPRRYSTRPS